MRPTRLGAAALALAAFTLFAAASTGNNLLYLLFAANAAALALGAAGAWAGLRGLSAETELPARVHRGVPFLARVRIRDASGRGARLVSAAGPLGASEPADVPPGGEAVAQLRLLLPERGRRRVDGLRLESVQPFGLFRARRRAEPAEALVLPSPGDAPGRAPDHGSGRDDAGRGGRDGDILGPRPYAPGDDARLIHWKLTARSGRPVVVERGGSSPDKAVVLLTGADDASVDRAAAECRRLVEAGVETGLAGVGVEVEPARGPAQLDRLLAALALAGDGARPRPAPGAPPRGDAAPADGRELRRLTLAGAVLVYAAMYLVEDVGRGPLLAFAPLLPLGWILHERGGPFLPARLSDALSAAALAYLLLFDWRASGVALANVHLIGYLLANRLLSPWTPGEIRQVFLILHLAFFLVSGLTISPWYFPAFLLWAAFSATWLAWQAGAPPRRPAAWAGPLGRQLAAAAVLGAAVFAAVPRVEGLRRFNPFVASGMDKLQIRSSAVTGFTEGVSLGHFGELRRSPARALRLRPAAPPRGEAPPVRVRGAAFDAFDGRRWGRKPLGRAQARRDGATLSFPAPESEDPWFDFEVYPMQASALFSVGAPRLVDGIAGDAWVDHTGSVRLASSLSGGARYRAFPAPAGWRPADASPEAARAAREAALQTPPDPSGRVAELARRWTEGLSDPRDKAEAIVSRLRTEYAYSTYSDGRRVSLEDFLFDTRRGACEYFGTAAAVLMRHAGVPARLVTGFLADDWNEWGRFYDVRQSQAHAWTEAWLPGRGWTDYDATPAESGLSAAAEALSRRLRRWFDAAQARWYRSVIGYDRYAQRDALLRLRLGRLLAAAQRGLEVLWRLAPLWAAAGLALWALRSGSWRRRREDEYERAERALARAGLPRAPWQTPREFARATAAARPELSFLEELAEAHYRRRYAGARPGAEERRRAEALLGLLKSRL